ncbi:YcnI family protein [Blastococcus sp. TF02A-26]|uniref:YcnI family protein n=1 Tax=Blastococcus sp. TF02A-26 TaxID=2250577 RepID=UPI000DE8D255|nr:YcnI family protein [Blastococcus sp. TF02A-26]RBY86976.1 nuclear export factor GLE1 [Blastococcus sp. TF02A-26]
MSLSPPRPVARLGLVLLAVLTALAASVAVASTASAHVTVSSGDAAPGGYGLLAFRVPNESDTARTVALRISIPEEAALASLRIQPVPGWTATLTESELDEPLESHGQEITRYVSVVEFRADAGAGIAPGQFQVFALSGGPFPDADTVNFPTVQTYDDGTEAAWIEPTVEGQDEPERPAPVLTLASAEANGDGTAAAEEDSGHGHGDVSDSGDASGLALFLAILALFTGVAGVVLGYRAGRRTVSS